MSVPEKYVTIGKILKPFGIKGELKIEILTDFPERFETTKRVYLFNEPNASFVKNEITGDTSFYIEYSELQISFVKLKFKNYNNPESIESLRNCLILVDEKDRVPLTDGRFYFYEIINFKVFNFNDEIGFVESVDNFGGNDLLNVKTIKHKNVLVPLVDEFVKKVDLKNKKILLELIDGFLD